MESSSLIKFDIDRFFYHSNNYEWTSEMPYFWFCFFKIDGSTCKLNDSLSLEGKASIYTPFEKIETLNNFESDKGDIIRIPDYLGKKDISVKPISVPEFIQESTVKKPEPQVGCVTVFMNKNCFLADSKNELPNLFSTIIQEQLDNSIPTLNEKKAALTNKTKPIANRLESAILNLSRKQLPFWKKFISEKKADATVWKFFSSELADLQTISLTKNWTNEGTWELSGSISLENPTFSKKDISFKKKKNQLIHLTK